MMMVWEIELSEYWLQLVRINEKRRIKRDFDMSRFLSNISFSGTLVALKVPGEVRGAIRDESLYAFVFYVYIMRTLYACNWE